MTQWVSSWSTSSSTPGRWGPAAARWRRLDDHLVVPRPGPQPVVAALARGALEIAVALHQVDGDRLAQAAPALQPGCRLRHRLSDPLGVCLARRGIGELKRNARQLHRAPGGRAASGCAQEASRQTGVSARSGRLTEPPDSAAPAGPPAPGRHLGQPLGAEREHRHRVAGVAAGREVLDVAVVAHDAARARRAGADRSPRGRSRRRSTIALTAASRSCAWPASSARKCSKRVKSVARPQKMRAASAGCGGGRSRPRAPRRCPSTSWVRRAALVRVVEGLRSRTPPAAMARVEAEGRTAASASSGISRSSGASAWWGSPSACR